MPTEMTQLAALRWLAKWSGRSFLSRSLPSRPIQILFFSWRACRLLSLPRRALAEGVRDSPHHACSRARESRRQL